MASLKWDQTGHHYYETGVDHGVLYVLNNNVYTKGIAWDGLTSVSESPSGAESTKHYADNIPYLDLTSAEEFGATIGCFYTPPEFDECDGTKELLPGVYLGQQRRKSFGFSYRNRVGNDTEGDSYGYKLHLVYGAKVSPTERSHSTVNDAPEPAELSYEVTTTPVGVSVKDADGNAYKPVSHIVIDSTRIDPEKLKKIEEILYGVDPDPGVDGDAGTEPRLPLPDEIYTILAAA